jgi:hypothetical protein
MSDYDMNAVRRLNRLTGNYFTKINGYDFRKTLSRSRHKTLLKYLAKMHELTRPPFVKMIPKKGEKKIIYSFTGQDKYKRFKYAIIRTPEKTKKANVRVDKSKPKGLQVEIDYPKIQKYEIRIPKEYLMYFIYSDDREGMIEYIEEVAPNGEIFAINAEGGSIWRRISANAEAAVNVLFEYIQRYSAAKFATTDFSYFYNWLDSISIFNDYDRAAEHFADVTETAYQRINEWTRITGSDIKLRYSSKHRGFYVSQDGELTGEFISLADTQRHAKITKMAQKARGAYEQEKQRQKLAAQRIEKLAKKRERDRKKAAKRQSVKTGARTRSKR